MRGLWDLKVGRFRTWRVYHKGAGFDLYTIEDQGACIVRSALDGACNLDSGTFGPHTYEVSYIYDREPAGRVGVHVYPTPWSGIEVVGTLGNSGNANIVGGRAAAMQIKPRGLAGNPLAGAVGGRAAAIDAAGVFPGQMWQPGPLLV